MIAILFLGISILALGFVILMAIKTLVYSAIILKEPFDLAAEFIIMVLGIICYCIYKYMIL